MIFVNRNGDERCDSSTAQRLESTGIIQRRVLTAQGSWLPSTGQISSPCHASLPNSAACTPKEAGDGAHSSGTVQPILSHSKGLQGQDDKCS